MRAFFGVVFILIGSLMFLCGGIFVTGNGGNESRLGIVLGIIPGGLLLAIGIRLFGWDSSKNKISKSDAGPK
ncbi:hypothetical protein EBR03_05575 [bacterium]|nr:hypothetical protein [bacterium]